MDKKSELLLTFANIYTHMFKKVDRHLGVHSISFTEFLVMHTISTAPDGAIRRIDLAEEVGMSASGVTRLLNPLEKLHIIIKEKNARDARVSLVRLSTDGQEVYRDAMNSFKMISKDLLAPLDETQITTMMQIYKVLS